jgi:site-specific DNA-methyltransferase (adenine-specific)
MKVIKTLFGARSMQKNSIEQNKVYLLDVKEFLNKLPDNYCDLIVADPPYNQSIDKWDIFKSQKDYILFMENWLELSYKKLKTTGSIYLFNTPLNSALLLPSLLKMGFLFQNWIIWYKKDGFKPSNKRFVSNQEVILFLTKSKKYSFNYNEIRIPYISKDRMITASTKGILKNGKRWFPNPNGKMCTDVWEIASERHRNKINGKIVKHFHPTPKPTELIKRIISASSNKKDLVLDLFSGSGVTSLIAKKLERNFIACDNNELYVNLLLSKITS